jgi:hypothetical protein
VDGADVDDGARRSVAQIIWSVFSIALMARLVVMGLRRANRDRSSAAYSAAKQIAAVG